MWTVPRSEDYLFVSLQIEDKSALPPTPVDPDANPLGLIYHDVAGAPVPATWIAGGSAAFVKQAGTTGFYGVGLPIEPDTTLGRYLIHVTFNVGGTPQSKILYFEVVELANSLAGRLSAIG
jgi:hypothetical protein